MKKLFLTTTALVMTSGAAFAQTSTGPGVDPNDASATSNLEATATIDGSAEARAEDSQPGPGGSTGEEAVALVDGQAASVANPNGAIEAFGGIVGASATIVGGSTNRNLQFQIGNDNQAVNLQVGSNQASATLQVGDLNDAIVSQTFSDNEAAVVQLGEDNDGSIIQNGFDNAAAIASVGDLNQSIILQVGPDNIAANAQFGDSNTALVFQNDGDNTAANVQVGDLNQSFISQGGGDEQTVAAIDGTLRTVDIPTGLIVGGAVAGTARLNSAASAQVGDNNRSAIIQQGNGNEAVNYQDSSGV